MARTRTYDDCPNCLRDWGMGLMYENGQLVVGCIDCGFRGPGASGSPSVELDAEAIRLWNELPRKNRIAWTPELRTERTVIR